MASLSPRQIVVLVVEDEPLILMDAVDIVEDAGFRTVTATNADEAVVILEARADVRIVVTDVDMPGSMNGLKLAAAIRRRWPPIELIVVSGKHDLTDDDLPSGGRFLGKPFEVPRLTATLHEMAARLH